MTKKDEPVNWIWVVLIAAAALLIIAPGIITEYTGQLQSITSGGFGGKPSLEELLSPYLMDTAEDTCEATGGAWYESANRVGCFGGAINEDVVCESPMWEDVMEVQCEAVGAETVCDDENVGCYYA